MRPLSNLDRVPLATLLAGHLGRAPLSSPWPAGIVVDLIAAQLATPSGSNTLLNWGFHEPTSSETLLLRRPVLNWPREIAEGPHMDHDSMAGTNGPPGPGRPDPGKAVLAFKPVPSARAPNAAHTAGQGLARPRRRRRPGRRPAASRGRASQASRRLIVTHSGSMGRGPYRAVTYSVG